jgi:hypothetical protein
MTHLSPGLFELEHDLTAAVGRLATARHRRVRRLRVAAATGLVAVALSATALASGWTGLPLDPTKWDVLQSGEVDGKAAYVHAREKTTGRESTFLVEHDRGLDPYDAFLLHERVQAAATTAAGTTPPESGPLCTRAQLTRAENVALAALQNSFPPGTAPDATRSVVDRAVGSAFADSPCRGLEWAGERARFAYAGVEPRKMLMPGAR